MYKFKTQKSKLAGRRQTKALKSFSEVKVISTSLKNTNFKIVLKEGLRTQLHKVADFGQI